MVRTSDSEVRTWSNTVSHLNNYLIQVSAIFGCDQERTKQLKIWSLLYRTFGQFSCFLSPSLKAEHSSNLSMKKLLFSRRLLFKAPDYLANGQLHLKHTIRSENKFHFLKTRPQCSHYCAPDGRLNAADLTAAGPAVRALEWQPVGSNFWSFLIIFDQIWSNFVLFQNARLWA